MTWAVIDPQTFKVYGSAYTKVKAKALLDKVDRRSMYAPFTKIQLELCKLSKVKTWQILAKR